MPVVKYRVCLSDRDHMRLVRLVFSPSSTPKIVMHAQVLLLADECRHQPKLSEQDIAQRLDINVQTVHTIRRRYATEGLDAAIKRKKRQVKVTLPRITPEIKKNIYDLSQSAPPIGHARWTLRLLATHAREQRIVERISHETVGQLLKKRI
jgi:transposase